MSVELLVSEGADYCPVCMEMTILSWNDTDLNEPICEDCARSLVEAESALLKSNMNRPSPELIHRNP